jgi:hypothetical protein
VRRALVAFCLAAAAGAEEPHAFVETEVAREACWIGEAVQVTLRVGVERAFFDRNAVQMFQQRLDVPVHVDAPWLAELRTPGGAALTLALNDAIVAAAQRPDRDGFTVVEVAGTLRPDAPGEFVLAAPRLRYAYATKFRENLVYGRMPVDRREGFATGPRVVLDVRALPPAPDGYTGAIGRFRVRADAPTRDVRAGDVFKLTLTITGKGNLDRIGTPRLALPGFHVYGARDDRAGTVVYDVAAIAAVAEVPAIPFVAFDPEAGVYATVRTDPIPLTVRGAPERKPAREPGWPVWPWLVVPVLAIGLVMSVLRARRREEPPDAATVFAERADTDLVGALTDYLAARLACPAAAVIGPDLAARLAAAGVPEPAAACGAELMERLVGARYGGTPEPGDRAAADALVAELEGVKHA